MLQSVRVDRVPNTCAPPKLVPQNFPLTPQTKQGCLKKRHPHEAVRLFALSLLLYLKAKRKPTMNLRNKRPCKSWNGASKNTCPISCSASWLASQLSKFLRLRKKGKMSLRRTGLSIQLRHGSKGKAVLCVQKDPHTPGMVVVAACRNRAAQSCCG